MIQSVSYLPYEEPGIRVILSLTSFLLLLNGVRYALDRLMYCGIIGEILIGVVWGMPVGGTAWLTKGTQEAIQAFGFLGLISLVFEGGLSTDLALMRKSAYMSISIATVGLLMPIGLSFILLVLPFSSSTGTAYPSPLAAFSAGASLCSTSLGTTFAILSSASLQKTRVGVVLVGAAMMDDVVGLVMVNIVTTLGSGGTGGWKIARPIVSSFGLLLIVLGLMAFVLRPSLTWLSTALGEAPSSTVQTSHLNNPRKSSANLIRHIPNLNLILSTLVLIALVTIASFIDASVLFAAFIAGGVVNYIWGITNSVGSTSNKTPLKLYNQYYKQLMDFVLIPFFFASIGFSIPITSMFAGPIVWKGIVYSLLMIAAKGLVSSVIYFEYLLGMLRTIKLTLHRHRTKGIPSRSTNATASNTEMQTIPVSQPQVQNQAATKSPPHAIALLVGFAMVSRGEIGFLIASLSQSSGTLTYRFPNTVDGARSGEDIFLVITWAVALCTIAGPLGVGLVVRHLKQRNMHTDWLSEDQELSQQPTGAHSHTQTNS